MLGQGFGPPLDLRRVPQNEVVGARVVGDELRGASLREVVVARVGQLDRWVQRVHRGQHLVQHVRRSARQAGSGPCGTRTRAPPPSCGSPPTPARLRCCKPARAAGGRPEGRPHRYAADLPHWWQRSSSRTGGGRCALRAELAPHSLLRAWSGRICVGSAAVRRPRCQRSHNMSEAACRCCSVNIGCVPDGQIRLARALR